MAGVWSSTVEAARRGEVSPEQAVPVFLGATAYRIERKRAGEGAETHQGFVVAGAAVQGGRRRGRAEALGSSGLLGGTTRKQVAL